jgi:23S rRNA (guanosine2251-2'-O)-methyltransferase
MGEHLKKSTADLESERMSEWQSRERFPVIIILDNVRSGLNVGSVFRSADAFHVQEVVCCGITPIPPQREVLKSALGSTETVPWRHAESALSVVQDLQKRGTMCWAVEQAENSTLLHRFAWDQGQSIAFIFGNEVDGVHQEIVDACDGVLEIQQYGTKHSLNVAVSAGLVMYEFVRRR